MPILNWIGKEVVVNHDKEVPFRLLKKVKSLSYGENSQNLIIHGDNLEALKALMPYYQGQVKCIYIDPPYNTGNEGWVYNDKVNSPKIKKWLGKVVGSESEDLCRHDKWLCMMYPRLKLLRDLLSDDGVIFVSIDDNEMSNLRKITDEIFDERNFIAQLVWKKKAGGGSDTKYFANDHEYVLVYAKEEALQKRYFIELDNKMKEEYKYRDENYEKLGSYKRKNLYQTGIETDRPNLKYAIECPDGTKVMPPTIWRWSKETFDEARKQGKIDFVKNKKGQWQIFTKMYLYDENGGEYRVKPRSILLDVGFTKDGNNDLKKLFGETKPFNYPKPVRLIEFLLKIGAEKNSVILDSFAGSGTTAHAVLDMNKEDGGNRKFILVELEDKVAKDITAERVKRAIEKYSYKDGFEFCELDKPLFNENGQIEQECTFEQLATYIYFTETNTNIDRKAISGNFIGSYDETEYYLIFKERGKNVLNKEFLNKLEKNNKRKVIYADKCLIDERTLEKHNIQFKQIPYEVRVY
jgi:adenine specific DNA methylase Mod